MAFLRVGLDTGMFHIPTGSSSLPCLLCGPSRSWLQVPGTLAYSDLGPSRQAFITYVTS